MLVITTEVTPSGIVHLSDGKRDFFVLDNPGGWWSVHRWKQGMSYNVSDSCMELPDAIEYAAHLLGW